MWNELICSDDEEYMLCGLVFPQLQLGVAAGRQQIYGTIKLSEGCNIFAGKKKKNKDCSRGGSHKSKQLDLSLSINSLLLWQQTGLSHFPNIFW